MFGRPSLRPPTFPGADTPPLLSSVVRRVSVRSFTVSDRAGLPRQDRRVLNGIFWVLRSGARWWLPSYSLVSGRLDSEWSRSRVWIAGRWKGLRVGRRFYCSMQTSAMTLGRSCFGFSTVLADAVSSLDYSNVPSISDHGAGDRDLRLGSTCRPATGDVDARHLA